MICNTSNVQIDDLSFNSLSGLINAAMFVLQENGLLEYLEKMYT